MIGISETIIIGSLLEQKREDYNMLLKQKAGKTVYTKTRSTDSSNKARNKLIFHFQVIEPADCGILVCIDLYMVEL